MSNHQTPPRVSIGMPVYNGGRYLRESLTAIQNQTFRAFEVIISDNDSSDDTQAICEEFAAADDRIRYIRRETNLGMAGNFNSVVDEAQAPYFKWATHDDLLCESFVQECVAALDAAPPNVVLVYGQTILIDENGHEIGPYDDGLDLREVRPSDRLRHFLTEYELSNALHGLHRIDTLRQTSKIAAYGSSDVTLLAQIALAGQIWELPDPIFYRRIHDESSIKANPTAEALVAAFLPEGQTVERRPMPRTRLLWEHYRSVATAAISRRERLRAGVVLTQVWGKRYWRVAGGEWKRALLDRLDRVRTR